MSSLIPAQHPVIIQGGMGVGISSWRLAGAVARTGQLGVVSGTALDAVIARRLQDGDLGGHVRRALSHFPFPAVAARVVARFYREGGRDGAPYAPIPRLSLHATATGPGSGTGSGTGAGPTHSALASDELGVVGNFVEVWLAKDGHHGVVGINFLEKIQMASGAAAYGAMLAGVDYVLMGAGIPRDIPQLLDELAAHRPGTVHVDVAGGDARPQTFDPSVLAAGLVDVAALIPLRRPTFLAIVSAQVLAQYLDREQSTRPDGFVVEGPRAGGHNAPPRGRLQLDERGQPIYGPRDQADVAAFAKLGLPFWLAGGYGEPERVRAALDAGAAGVQVGTLFALCRESGLAERLREQLLHRLRAGDLDVRTDASASPTGFPFKVAGLPGTLTDGDLYAQRPRRCDLGYLRQPFQRSTGAIGYRCPAEPVEIYGRKGGDVAATDGAKCLCNALLADIDLAQTRRDGYTELPLVTLGTELVGARRLDSEHWLHGGSADGWSATEAVAWLMREVGVPVEIPLPVDARPAPAATRQ